MKHLKLYEGFRPIASVYSDIGHICQEYYIENYTINEDGDVDLCDCNNQIPFPDTKDKLGKKLPLKFNIVNGEFYCHSNQLTTLEGSPKKVSGSFDCRGNNLTSLKGGPIEIGNNLICNYNLISTLKDFPLYLGGFFTGATDNDLPKLIIENAYYINDIIRCQNDYSIWNQDGTLNEYRFKDMMIEIKSE